MGNIVYLEREEAEVRNARRLWKWTGAASLSQLAQEGTKTPSECKFPVAVESVVLTEVIEVLAVTDNARRSIDKVPIWTA
jgi:hypothetical protein